MTIDLDDPVALMLAAASSFEAAGIEAAAYGGLTLGMYGEPRETPTSRWRARISKWRAKR